MEFLQYLYKPTYISMDNQLQANRKNLLLLCYLRAIGIAGQIATLTVVDSGFRIALPVRQIIAAILFSAFLNVIAYGRYRSGKVPKDIELFIYLMVDVAGLTVIFYFSGGATNPFINLYLLQVVIAATILKSLFTWMLVIFTLTCYIYLSFFYIEIPHLHHYHIGEFFNLHIHGMLLSYAISAFILAYFIIRMSVNLKQQDAELVNIRQKQVAEENIMAMAMFAANAAHKLGTPLGTIMLLAGEYKEEADSSILQKRSAILLAEIRRCKEIISGITDAAGAMRAESGKVMNADQYIRELCERWKDGHPQVKLRYDLKTHSQQIVADYSITQAIINILDNAADVSDEVVIITQCNNLDILFAIEDKGPGRAIDIINKIAMPASTKIKGMGMGLYLTHAIVTRFGGQLKF